MRSTDPLTGQVTAKLLDFGLSKNAGAGSSAKTFVGTPCYLGQCVCERERECVCVCVLLSRSVVRWCVVRGGMGVLVVVR